MSTLYVSFKACLYNQPLTNASNLCIPPHSKNEDFHADIAAKPFADQRAYHHGTYCIKIIQEPTVWFVFTDNVIL